MYTIYRIANILLQKNLIFLKSYNSLSVKKRIKKLFPYSFEENFVITAIAHGILPSTT